MKKRLLCLLLALILVVPMLLTACSSSAEETDEETADIDEDTGAVSITMRVITEKDNVFNSDEELEKFLKDECGGDKESAKYKEALATKIAYDAVEAEFTKITKSKYKVNVDLVFCTEEGYSETLKTTMEEYLIWEQEAQYAERALEKYVEDYNAQYPGYPEAAVVKQFYRDFPRYEEFKYYSSDDEEGAFEEQYQENELGIKELVYPTTTESQLDIIYISGKDMYEEYIENDWIMSLDDQLSSTGKKLGDYISPTLLNGVKVDGSTYAIPNNVQMGEYTYMLIDKELFDTYYGDINSVKSILDCEIFLEDVNANTDVLPIASTFEDCMDLFVWYWNIAHDTTTTVIVDPITGEKEKIVESTYTWNGNGLDNSFNVVGCLYGDPANIGRGRIDLGFTSLFTNPEYRDMYLTLSKYQWEGYYGEAAEGERAAISFVNGTYSVLREAEKNDGVYVGEDGREYYPIVAKYPEADEQDLYGNMFAVSSNSDNVLACMQVLTLLNTNPELRNILQYGLTQEQLPSNAKDKGIVANYAVDEETGVLTRLNDLYLMDVRKTGNCFIAHPEEGLAPDYWEDAKKQNNQALINPLLGFDFNEQLAEYDAIMDNSLIDLVDDLTEQTLKSINACASYEELCELVEDLGDSLTAANAKVYPEGYDPVPVNLKKYTDKAYDTSNSDPSAAEPVEDTNGESPYTVYYTWLTTYGYAP